MGRPPRFIVLLATATTTGCAAVVEDGLRSLVGDGGPPRTEAQYVAPPTVDQPSFREAPPRAEASGIQYAPTLDWRMGIAPLPYAPGRSMFEGMAAKHMPCQSVPVGLAQAFAGPTGPAASPLYRWGPIEVGVTGPDGTVAMLDAVGRHALSVRALSSGARMASAGSTCSMRVFFYVRIGRTDDAISVLR